MSEIFYTGRLQLGAGHTFGLAPWAIEKLTRRSGTARQVMLDRMGGGKEDGYYCLNCGLSLRDVMRIITLMKVGDGSVYGLVCVPRASVIKAIGRGSKEVSMYDALAGFDKAPEYASTCAVAKAQLDARTAQLDGGIPFIKAR